MKTKEELLKIYSAYLPYKLRISTVDRIFEVNKIEMIDEFPIWAVVRWDEEKLQYYPEINLMYHGIGHGFEFKYIKPILYSMEMLTQKIQHKGEKFLPLDKIGNLNLGHCDWISNERERLIEKYGFEHWFDVVPMGIVTKLLEWHFNVFGLEESEYIKKETL